MLTLPVALARLQSQWPPIPPNPHSAALRWVRAPPGVPTAPQLFRLRAREACVVAAPAARRTRSLQRAGMNHPDVLAPRQRAPRRAMGRTQCPQPRAGASASQARSMARTASTSQLSAASTLASTTRLAGSQEPAASGPTCRGSLDQFSAARWITGRLPLERRKRPLAATGLGGDDSGPERCTRSGFESLPRHVNLNPAALVEGNVCTPSLLGSLAPTPAQHAALGLRQDPDS